MKGPDVGAAWAAVVCFAAALLIIIAKVRGGRRRKPCAHCGGAGSLKIRARTPSGFRLIECQACKR